MATPETTNGNIYYVNIEKGSARGEGTKEAPMKDIQKAIDKAADGDLIRISEGNYLGTMDRGWQRPIRQTSVSDALKVARPDESCRSALLPTRPHVF